MNCDFIYLHGKIIHTYVMLLSKKKMKGFWSKSEIRTAIEVRYH